MNLKFDLAILRASPSADRFLFLRWLNFLLLLAAQTAFSAESGWPQFRGPRGDSTAPEADPPVQWSETNHITWKVSVPGRGRSSPVVLGERIWMTTAIEQGVRRTRIGSDDMQTAEHVTLKANCLNRADGRILWEILLFDVDKPDPVHWLNSWATPTPAVELGRLYCDFGTFGTAFLNAETGEILWQRRVALDHQVGPGSSPVLYQNELILVRDGRDAQYVTALDKKTGETVWKTDRPPINASSPNLKKSFCSPLFFEHAGRLQMIVPGPHWVVSYEPATGKEIWRARHGEGFSIGASAVFGHGLVFFSTGCFKAQLYAIRADGQGDVTATHVAWKSLRQIPIMPSPILAGDELYWVSDDGMVSCADAKTGTIHWQERLGASHLATPIFATDRLYFFAQNGKTTVVKAGKQFERLGENPLEGTVVATPAVVGQTIFFRTDTHLYRIEKK
jgi:outer membrane protein assembly factor BamB